MKKIPSALLFALLTVVIIFPDALQGANPGTQSKSTRSVLRPDLAVEEFTLSEDLLHLKIKNVGTTSAESTEQKLVWLKENDTIIPRVSLVIPLPSLGAGKSRVFEVEKGGRQNARVQFLFTNRPAEAKKLRLTLDFDSSLKELNERNNTEELDLPRPIKAAKESIKKTETPLPPVAEEAVEEEVQTAEEVMESSGEEELKSAAEAIEEESAEDMTEDLEAEEDDSEDETESEEEEEEILTAPDLLIANMQWNRTGLLNYEVRNSGTDIAEGVTVGFQWLNAKNTPVDSGQKITLEATLEAGSSLKNSGIEPKEMTDYLYRPPRDAAKLQIEADPDNDIDELNEANNTVSLKRLLADLAIQNVRLSNKNLTYKVKNLGAANTDNFYIKFLWLGSNNTAVADPMEFQVDYLAPDASRMNDGLDQKEILDYLVSSPASAVKLHIQADSKDGIAESNEKNNNLIINRPKKSK